MKTKKDTFKIIGKVDAINQGLNFYNTTIFDVEKKALNIKLRENIDHVVIGQLYQFTVKISQREERPDENILTAVSIAPVEDVLELDEITKLYQTFYEFAPIEAKELTITIEKYLDKINNQILKDIVIEIYNKYKNHFYIHPAATKFHHAYVGGLAYHTLNMLRIAEQMCIIYPYLNEDLLLAGIIIHDVAKIDEISGVDGEYTNQGLLIGHIVLGVNLIDQVAIKLNYSQKEEVLLLKHMMISHHGQLIFGSPKKPQIAEAYMLWFIDNIDSKFQVIGETLDNTLDNSFTAAIPVADKTRFLKHSLTKK